MKFLERHGKAYPALSKLIINRIDLEKKAIDKIPLLYEVGGLFDRRSLEQCTSEKVANYKARLFEGEKALVLAAGLGIDDSALAKRFKNIISIEQNVELNEISKFNFSLLQQNNIERISDSAESYINHTYTIFDLIYVDPDRRQEEKRQILLSDHSPDMIALLPVLFKLTETIAIKVSPLYDHVMALKELSHVSELIAISYKGEMKELLIVCRKKENNSVRIRCVDVGEKTIEAQFNLEDSLVLPAMGLNGRYLFEAGASLVKMRKAHEYANRISLSQIDSKVPYYIGEQPIEDFLGRQFEILERMPFSLKILRSYLNTNGIAQINLKVRGGEFNTAELSKSLKVKEGGEDYIFILPSKGDTLAFHCRRIKR